MLPMIVHMEVCIDPPLTLIVPRELETFLKPENGAGTVAASWVSAGRESVGRAGLVP